MKHESTETYLRWIEAQAWPPKTFLLPSPEEAGMLAACRLKFTVYKEAEVTAEHPLVRACECKGWLEVRPLPAKAGAGGPLHAFMLTKPGRTALDAILAAGWPTKPTEE